MQKIYIKRLNKTTFNSKDPFKLIEIELDITSQTDIKNLLTQLVIYSIKKYKNKLKHDNKFYIDLALQAFKNGELLLFINDKKYTQLSTKIKLTNNDVIFVMPIPALMGKNHIYGNNNIEITIYELFTY